ncbi:hypothetical protein PDJAM_G00129450 [Pangasius djambal]|uniref:Uncharacterized protein n=1 Tax=Pangasius djambal TaxID=1691987 RepID=A0ACC5ZBE4_9TELE|nr:hypothetical protein [Pangasius djambal]
MKELIFCVILIATGALAQKEEIQLGNIEIAPCPRLCYTQWFDRDDPSGFGDYETLINLRAENPGKICSYPYSIQVQTLSGQDASTTGQVFAYYDTVNGFACVNAQQPKGKRCLDYRVRFVCPCPKWELAEDILIKETE